MKLSPPTRLPSPSLRLSAPAASLRCLLLLAFCFSVGAPARAQAPETIGRIEGDTFTATGQVSIAQENGRSVTTLLSGSQVTVTAGHARLILTDGGEIDICGPAQLSLLKSGGAITLALTHGKVHARISAELPLQIYTAMIVATPVSVGSRPRDAVVGLDAAGTMCVYPAHGAVRLEHQFSSQRVLVPQFGEVTIPGGQLENLHDAEGACRCEIPIAKRESPELPKPLEPPLRAQTQPKPEEKKTDEKEVPVYTAVMPPLTFSAEVPAPPPLPSVRMVRLTRELRLRPLVFTGTVEAPAKARAAAQKPAPTHTEAAAPQPKTSFGAKLKNFFRRLFGRRAS